MIAACNVLQTGWTIQRTTSQFWTLPHTRMEKFLKVMICRACGCACTHRVNGNQKAALNILALCVMDKCRLARIAIVLNPHLSVLAQFPALALTGCVPRSPHTGCAAISLTLSFLKSQGVSFRRPTCPVLRLMGTTKIQQNSSN